MQQIFDLLGEPVPGSPSAADLAGFSAYVRTWDRVNVDRLLIILFETPTAAEADFIVTNSLAEFRAQNYEAFDPGVPGTFGAVLTDAGFTVHVVMWQQGSYAVEIVGGSRDIARGKSAVGELASDQRDLLLSKLGVDASAVPDSKDNSVAYLAGKIAGTLAVFGVITAIVVLIVQRSRRKQNEAPLLPQPYGTFTPSGAPFVSPTQPPMPPPPPPPYDPPRHN